jgi:hypothetical protein
MNILALKLILAPIIIGSASLAGRRWGPAVSGWIVGMPLTSGPVIFFVALSHGASFAANAGLGVISGGLSLVAYALTYSWLATRFRWHISIAGSLLVFSLSTLFLQSTTISLLPIFALVALAILAGLRLMPNDEVVKNNDAKLSQWDIPARIFIGTSFILLLTGAAPLIGSRMTGLLTTIPLYVTILSIFAHRDHGAAAAAHVMRGLLYGMFAFTAFFLVLNMLIEKTSLGVSFGAAVMTALTVQGTSLFVLRKLHK